MSHELTSRRSDWNHTSATRISALLVRSLYLKHSTQDYDWLGRAVNFWENSEARAEDLALENHPGSESVVGAVLQLGRCLDLLDQQYINVIEGAKIEVVRLRRNHSKILICDDLRMRSNTGEPERPETAIACRHQCGAAGRR